MKITSFFILFTFLFSYQGEIVSIEFMDFMNVEDVQDDLDDTFGSVAPEAQYDISIYKIIYKTIDPFGEETNSIESPRTGVIIGLAINPLVRAGDPIANIVVCSKAKWTRAQSEWDSHDPEEESIDDEESLDDV